MTGNLSRAGKQRFWEEHIAKWRATELSQVEYCHRNKIGVKSFQYWKRKTKRGNGAPVLVEVSIPKSLISPAFSANTRLCLVVDGHYRIEIGRGFDSEDLERVVRVLGRV